MLLFESLLVGFLASDEQSMGIKPFATDMFKGFLAIFLLDMGIVCGPKLQDFMKSGWFGVVFAIAILLTNTCITNTCVQLATNYVGNWFIFVILAASGS